MSSLSTDQPGARSSAAQNFSQFALNSEEKDRLDQISRIIEATSFAKDKSRQISQDDPFDFAKMAELLSIYYEPKITSHRPYLGPIIVWGKRAILKFFNKWLMLSLVKQKELNQMVFDLALTVRTLEQRIEFLEKQQEGKV